MSNGAEPIPIKLGGKDHLQTNMDDLIKEAFRQGWESARHWPNHPRPQHLFVRIEPGDGPLVTSVLLTIEWP